MKRILLIIQSEMEHDELVWKLRHTFSNKLIVLNLR